MPQQAVVVEHQQETVKSAVLALVVQVPTSRHRSGVVAAQVQAEVEEAAEVVERHPTELTLLPATSSRP